MDKETLDKKDKIKNVVKILLVILVTGLCILLGVLGNQKYKEQKIDKGNEIFCDGKCDNNEKDHPLIGLTVMSSYVCQICEEVREFGSSPTPLLCGECAQETKRCEWCGKLEEEVKE